MSFADIFGTATRAGGGGFLSHLGSLLEPLDYPRQALLNVADKGKKILSGNGSWDDAIGMVPGLLGAGLAGGLMATGVGAPLGILAGSALGGLTQGLGKSADPEKFKARTTDELAKDVGINTDSLGGKVASFGLGMATDPLTYAGGLGSLVKQGGKGALREAAPVLSRTEERLGRLVGQPERRIVSEAALPAPRGLQSSFEAATGIQPPAQDLRGVYDRLKTLPGREQDANDALLAMMKGNRQQLLAEGAGSPTTMQTLLDARRQYPMAKGVSPRAQTIDRITGPVKDEGRLMDVVHDLMDAGGGAGMYHPVDEVAAVRRHLPTAAGAADEARAIRHENIHGIIDQASKSGNYDQLPLMMRLPAKLKSAEGGTAYGIGNVLDELAAQTLEAKGAGPRLKQAASFLFDHPWDRKQNLVRDLYAQDFSRTSPVAANLYRALGLSPYAAAAGGLGVGAGYGINALKGE